MILNGSDLMVFVNDGNKLKSVAYATEHQLSVNATMTDISTKDVGNGLWQAQELSLMSWTMNTSNLMSDSAENGLSANDLFDLMIKRQAVEVAFSLQTNNLDYSAKLNEEFKAPTDGWTCDASNQYHGKAYITDIQITATNGEKAQFTATFTGCSNLQKLGKGIEKAKTNTVSLTTPTPVVETATKK